MFPISVTFYTKLPLKIAVWSVNIHFTHANLNSLCTFTFCRKFLPAHARKSPSLAQVLVLSVVALTICAFCRPRARKPFTTRAFYRHLRHPHAFTFSLPQLILDTLIFFCVFTSRSKYFLLHMLYTALGPRLSRRIRQARTPPDPRQVRGYKRQPQRPQKPLFAKALRLEPRTPQY